MRITQMHGSMFNDDALAVVDTLQKEKESREQSAVDRKLALIARSEVFLRCKNGCLCQETPCKAAAYKECSVCHSILKTQCSKAACKAAGREMIKPAVAVTSSIPSSRSRSQQDPDSTTDDSDTTEPSDAEMIFADSTSADSDVFSTDFYASTTDASGDEEVTYRRKELKALLEKTLSKKFFRGREKGKQNTTSLQHKPGQSTSGLQKSRKQGKTFSRQSTSDLQITRKLSKSRSTRFTDAVQSRKTLPDVQDDPCVQESEQSDVDLFEAVGPTRTSSQVVCCIQGTRSHLHIPVHLKIL